MKKAIKIFLLSKVVILLIFFAFSVYLQKVHHTTAHLEFVKLVNERFEGKLTFKNFDYSYFKSFPKVYISIDSISINGSNSGNAKIGKLEAFLNLRSLWDHKIEIEKFRINNVLLHSEIDSLGNKPQFVLKKKEPSGDSKFKFIFDSHDIEIKNSQFYFGNMFKRNRFYIGVQEGLLNLSVQDSIILISGNVSAKLDTIITNQKTLFKNQPVSVENAVFKINRATGVKELLEGVILAHTLKLMPSLKITPFKDGNIVDFHILSEGNFDTTLELLEFHSNLGLTQINPDAELSIAFNQQGFMNPFEKPYFELDFAIVNSVFSGEKLPFPIENFSVIGNYNNGEKHSPESAELVIDTLHAEVNDSYVNARLKLNNFKDPIIDGHLISKINLSHLIGENEKYSGSGVLDIDVLLDGKISEIRKLHLEGVKIARGKINLRDLNLEIKEKGYSIRNLNASAILDNQFFEVTFLEGDINKSAIRFNGIIDNFIQHLSYENEELSGKLNLNFDELDLNDFDMEKFSKKSGNFYLPMNAMELNITGTKIISEIGVIENIHLKTSLNSDEIIIQSFGLNYQQGEITGSAGLMFNQNEIDSVYADIKGEFEKLDFEIPKDTVQNQTNGHNFSMPSYINAHIDLNIEEGSIQSIPIENLILQADVNGKEMSVKRFSVKAYDGESDVSGHLYFNDNGISKIEVNSTIKMDQFDLGKFINERDESQKNNAELSFSDLPLKMKIQLDVFVNGIKYKDQYLSDFSANMDISDDQISVKRLMTTLPYGKLDLSLQINQMRSDSINYTGSVDMNLDTVYLDQFLKSKALGLPDTKSDKSKNLDASKKDKRSFTFPNNITLKLSSKAKRIYYKNAEIDNLDISIDLNSKKLDLNNLDFDFVGGHVSTLGYFNYNNSGLMPAYLFAKTDSLELKQLLRTFNNFDQNVFNSENSSGKLSWKSEVYFNLNESFSPVKDDNLWKFDMVIHEAEFKNIEPIENALFFIGHKTKDDLIVKELDLSAYFYDRKILFKDLFMNDNIANLDLFGEIDLVDSSIDVGAEISLSDLFFRSKKKRMIQTKEGEVHLDKDEKVFIKMEGPIATHKLKMSSKRNFKRERQSLSKSFEKAEKELTLRKGKSMQ